MGMAAAVGRKRRSECEYGEAAEETDEKQSSTNYPSVEVISEYEEVESCLIGAFQYVDGHRVKAEFAPQLKAIFGDITRGNDVKSPSLLSTFLERICHAYQRLEQTDLTRAELQGMISELRLFERRQLRVRWILERVECASIEKDLEAYERQVCLPRRKISSTKAQLLVMHKAKARNDQMKQEVGATDAVQEQSGGAQVNRRGGAAVRRSTRPRKEPHWHKPFCFSY